MKKELELPSILGFCKNCFNKRRHGSAFCGECQDKPKRMTIYWDDEFGNLPIFTKLIDKFKLNPKQISKMLVTYGDTIFASEPPSYGLISHELTHVFQQEKVGLGLWWEKYMDDVEFRLSQELEAYQNQLKTYILRNPANITMASVLAKDLSGKMYGEIITFEEAKKLIINN